MSSEFPPVLILCGGLGTRLGGIAQDVPKAMVPVAGAPFIAHQLRLLSREKVEKVVLCVAHMQAQIENYVEDGDRFGLEVTYSYDGPNRLGTGGAIRKALPLVGDRFAVLYGDTYLDIEFAPVYRTFLDRGVLGLMTVLANENRWDKSNIHYEHGTVVAYNKIANSHMRHIDYGLSILSARAFDRYHEEPAFDLAVVFQQLIRDKQMCGYEVTKRFYEIGTPESLAETEAYLRRCGR